MELIGTIIFVVVISFLFLALISKATGVGLRTRRGPFSSGDTIVTPDTLDDLASDVRKLVDKKYKRERFLKNDWKIELKRTIKPIEDDLYTIFIYIHNKKYGYKLKNESAILALIGINGSEIRPTNFSNEELEKLKQLENILKAKQLEIIEEYTIKYAGYNSGDT